jgi:DNA-binding transcriptional LysR family regulator
MNIDQLDLNLLRALDVLLDECHVTRAAARLHLTQPAMSAALARLRQAFGDPLLVRGKGVLLPTPRALALGPQVRALMLQLAALAVSPSRFDPAVMRRRFTLATTDYVHLLLEPWLTALMQQAPGLDLAVVAVDSDRLTARLERGEVDLAVLNLQRTPEGLRSRTAITERFVVISRRAHPKLRRALTLDGFCALEHVLVSPRGGSFSGPTDEALAQLGRRRRVRLSVQSFAQVPSLVAASDLIAVYPALLAARFAHELKIVEPPLAIPGFTMVTAWHERTHHEPAQRWLRDAVYAALRGKALDRTC